MNSESMTLILGFIATGFVILICAMIARMCIRVLSRAAHDGIPYVPEKAKRKVKLEDVLRGGQPEHNPAAIRYLFGDDGEFEIYEEE